MTGVMGMVKVTGMMERMGVMGITGVMGMIKMTGVMGVIKVSGVLGMMGMTIEPPELGVQDRVQPLSGLGFRSNPLHGGGGSFHPGDSPNAANKAAAPEKRFLTRSRADGAPQAAKPIAIKQVP